jgi:hypothetical protein
MPRKNGVEVCRAWPEQFVFDDNALRCLKGGLERTSHRGEARRTVIVHRADHPRMVGLRASKKAYRRLVLHVLSESAPGDRLPPSCCDRIAGS